MTLNIILHRKKRMYPYFLCLQTKIVPHEIQSRYSTVSICIRICTHIYTYTGVPRRKKKQRSKLLHHGSYQFKVGVTMDASSIMLMPAKFVKRRQSNNVNHYYFKVGTTMDASSIMVILQNLLKEYKSQSLQN